MSRAWKSRPPWSLNPQGTSPPGRSNHTNSAIPEATSLPAQRIPKNDGYERLLDWDGQRSHRELSILDCLRHSAMERTGTGVNSRRCAALFDLRDAVGTSSWSSPVTTCAPQGQTGGVNYANHIQRQIKHSIQRAYSYDRRNVNVTYCFSEK